MGIFDKLSSIAEKVKAGQASVHIIRENSSSASSSATTTSTAAPDQGLRSPSSSLVDHIQPSNRFVSDDESNSWQEVSHKKMDYAELSETPSKQSKLPTFTENKLHRVNPDDLVWAPFYRYSGQLFPARLCHTEELVFDPSAPMATDEVTVVEFFSQIKKSNTTQRDAVETARLVPYWAYKGDDDETSADKTAWNAKRIASMKKALNHSNESSGNARIIFERVLDTANNFLQLAISDTITQCLPENDDSLDNAAPLILDETRRDADTEDSEVHNLLSLAYKDDGGEEENGESLILRVGDCIRYHNSVLGKMLRTNIIGFTSSAETPLLLEDNYVLDKNTFIGKVDDRAVAIPTAASATRDTSQDKKTSNMSTNQKKTKRSRKERDEVEAEMEINPVKRSRRSQVNASTESSQPAIEATIENHSSGTNHTIRGKLYPVHKFHLVEA